jgi:hypothetical protein
MKLTISAGLLLTVLACYTRVYAAYDIFLIPQDEFYAKVERVALAPVVLQTEIAVPESILVHLDSLIMEKLNVAGFDVVPSVVYDEIWTRLNEETGGFFDPYTGERDEALFNKAVERLKQELTEGFSPDALIYPEVWPVEAGVTYGTAHWDGVSRSASRLAEVLALSLVVIVEDMDGTELYVNGGGLGVTEAWSRTLGIVTLPPLAAFQVEEWMTEAVDVALRPLVSNRPEREPADNRGEPIPRR